MDFGSKYVYKYSLSEEESVSEDDNDVEKDDSIRRSPTAAAEG